MIQPLSLQPLYFPLVYFIVKLLPVFSPFSTSPFVVRKMHFCQITCMDHNLDHYGPLILLNLTRPGSIFFKLSLTWVISFGTFKDMLYQVFKPIITLSTRTWLIKSPLSSAHESRVAYSQVSRSDWPQCSAISPASK